MRRRVFLTVAMGAAALSAAEIGYSVKWVGEMRKVMMMGQDDGTIALDSLQNLQHLYALGPVEGLNGEITVFDGQSLVATIRDGRPAVQNTFTVKAPMLVYTQVTKWSQVSLPASVRTLSDIAKFARSSAQKAGLDLKAPFPFRITGHAREIGMHVVNRQGRDAKGAAAHEAIEVKIPLQDRDVELLGFWSDKHEGVFTHMGSTIHVHGRTADNQISGHVDAVTLASGSLWLPAAH